MSIQICYSYILRSITGVRNGSPSSSALLARAWQHRNKKDASQNWASQKGEENKKRRETSTSPRNTWTQHYRFLLTAHMMEACLALSLNCLSIIGQITSLCITSKNACERVRVSFRHACDISRARLKEDVHHMSKRRKRTCDRKDRGLDVGTVTFKIKNGAPRQIICIGQN